MHVATMQHRKPFFVPIMMKAITGSGCVSCVTMDGEESNDMSWYIFLEYHQPSRFHVLLSPHCPHALSAAPGCQARALKDKQLRRELGQPTRAVMQSDTSLWFSKPPTSSLSGHSYSQMPRAALWPHVSKGIASYGAARAGCNAREKCMRATL